MFDNIFDNIIFLIPVAIIIGRLFHKARNKNKPPPKKPPQPYIPIHFEDDIDDDEPEVKEVVKERQPEISILESSPVKPAVVTRNLPLPETGVQKDFFANLQRLSPLKQAVVMSEVLGPPKALQ